MQAKKRILIIEDERDLVDFMRSLLDSHGYEVAVAFDGKEGLQRLQGRDPDLLILDIAMPRMGGMEFFTRICSPYGRPRFPVIVLTGVPGLIDFFEMALVDAFFMKPFQITALLNKIESLLSGEALPVVFLIDEDTPLSHQIFEALKKERLRVVRTNDIARAEKASEGRSPDYVLLEYYRKGLNGPQEIARIKSSVPLNKAPLIVYTFTQPVPQEAEVLGAGAESFVDDPRDLRSIFTAIRRNQKKPAWS